MHTLFRHSGILAAFLLFCLPCAAQDMPKRIISLAPSLTRQIYDLKQQDRLIGITSFCPAYAQGKEVVGSLTLLNFEKICSLKPDLILASTDCNKKIDIEKLQKLGLKIVIFEGCESFACMCREFVHLGRLLGKEQESQDIISGVQKELDKARARIAMQPRLKVFWQMGTNPLVTASNKTFTGELIGLAGCDNIFGPLRAKYPRINIETVITGNPDVIFIVTNMGNQQTSNLLREPFKGVSAVKNGRVYYISGDLVCQPTPGMFIKAFRAVAERLHPGVM